jgi:hypothetical protein
MPEQELQCMLGETESRLKALNGGTVKPLARDLEEAAEPPKTHLDFLFAELRYLPQFDIPL